MLEGRGNAPHVDTLGWYRGAGAEGAGSWVDAVALAPWAEDEAAAAEDATAGADVLGASMSVQ